MNLISHLRYSFRRNYGIALTYLQRRIDGAILYIMMVLLATPAAIYSYQHQVPEIDLPEIASPQIMSDVAVQNEILVALPSVEPLELVPEVRSEAPPFHDFIMQASSTYKVEAALIRAIIMVESSNNPLAVSRRGAKGLMHLMPTTAKWMGVVDPFDPALNIDGGVRYLKRLLDRFEGDVQLALAAYNAGSRYVRKYNGVPPFKATRIYIKKVLKYRQEYQIEMASNDSDLTAV
ncbi:lytic transglycosylase domain-containing protein [Desulfosarcina sp.]|nr:lytic transglycosylase domain-containing protein [Desulfosarcina sp.]